MYLRYYRQLEFALQKAIKDFYKQEPDKNTCENLCKLVEKFFKNNVGEWIYQRRECTINNNILNVYKCSHCKCEQYTEREIHFNYCPVCGTRMKR